MQPKLPITQTHRSISSLNCSPLKRIPCPVYNNRCRYGQRLHSINGGGGDGGHNDRNEPSDDGGDDGPAWHWLPSTALLLAGIAAGSDIMSKLRALRYPKCHDPVSIVIPALNEANGIKDTIDYLRSLDPAPAEIIVVDSGSTDQTASLARKAGARVVRTSRGRAHQQNAGATAAKSPILFFVHADSRPPVDALAHIRRALRDPYTVMGGFTTLIEHEGRILKFTTAHQWLSTYYAPLLFYSPVSFVQGLRCMFGDQSLFCRAEDFHRVDGFDSRLPIMEDADLCVRMHQGGLKGGRKGRLRQLTAIARTSGRRIAAMGNLKTTYVHFRLALKWWWGASPEELWAECDRLYSDSYR